MKNKKVIAILVFISFLFAVGIGMMDYESESLVHLFTSDGGNLIMLLIMTIVFSLMGYGVLRSLGFLSKKKS